MNAASTVPLHVPTLLQRARLPQWLLPLPWPQVGAMPALADLTVAQGLIEEVSPHAGAAGNKTTAAQAWDLDGALVLPGLVDAHTHIDKCFTRRRVGSMEPGLLGAINAMMQDRQHWTPADVHDRASRALQWAWEAGVVHLRTHCDWWEADAQPLAWSVLRDLANEWADRLVVERVSLMPLHLFRKPESARRLAATIADSGPGAMLGGFIHTSNWDPQALRNLVQAARHYELAIDLHIDEELDPTACGLATLAELLREIPLPGRVVCGHACALSAQDDAISLATLDAVARVPITLVALPGTNLLLQDAATDRTPRQRGITRIKEARARDIPVLIASDNVQDPFCPLGSFDPLEALGLGTLAAQLDSPFDAWTDSVCRRDWLRAGESTLPLMPGTAADLIILPQADSWSFPTRSQPRVVMRSGRVVHGSPPTRWMEADDVRTGQTS